MFPDILTLKSADNTTTEYHTRHNNTRTNDLSQIQCGLRQMPGQLLTISMWFDGICTSIWGLHSGITLSCVGRKGCVHSQQLRSERDAVLLIMSIGVED